MAQFLQQLSSLKVLIQFLILRDLSAVGGQVPELWPLQKGEGLELLHRAH